MKWKLVIALLCFAALAAIPAAAQAPPAPHTVKLAFTDSNVGTTKYSVFRSSLTGKELFLADIIAPATSWVDLTPLLGMNFYELTATVGGIQSSASSEVSAQVPVPPSPTATVQ